MSDLADVLMELICRARRNGPCPSKAALGSVVVALLISVVFCLGACGTPEPLEVSVAADDQLYVLKVTGSSVTVRDLLDAVEVELGPLDRVEPDLYVEVVGGMSVAVTRVEEVFETEREPLPFSHQTMRSEAVKEGERRLLKTGANGEVELTYKVTLEDGVEVARELVRREVITEPVDEIMLVGVQGELTSVPISGTIVYLSGGNAWVMRESSDLRRNVTGSGELDGRVFALSRDGSRLLFTRAMVGDVDTPLNSLWMARTSLVGEDPVYLGVTGVVWADWAPDGRRLAYSTAERSGGVPGWKANNDLWLMTLPEEGSNQQAQIDRILPPTAELPYAWWGRTFAWSPDGNYVAYGQADEIGIVAIADRNPLSLATFPPFRTQSPWAWVPSVSWSSDGYLLAFVMHEGDSEGQDPEESPVFGLWVASADGELLVRLQEEVGMWSAPRWSPDAIGMLAYGWAQSPRNSQDSRYDLWVMDRDGSNTRQLFPPEDFMGLIAPDVAWSPFGDGLLVEYEGNLFRVDAETGELEQLTSDGQSSNPRWAR